MKALVALVALYCWYLLDAHGSPAPSHHDGSTVTLMLARLGLGPAAAPNNTSTTGTGPGACNGEEQDRPCLGSLPEDMCWGYENGCTEDRRLFVPKCEGSPTPW